MYSSLALSTVIATKTLQIFSIIPAETLYLLNSNFPFRPALALGDHHFILCVFEFDYSNLFT